MSRPVYILECANRYAHINQGSSPLVLRQFDPWREAIRHAESSGHSVNVYRCGADGDELILAMAQVTA
jgi:hypothetical protein